MDTRRNFISSDGKMARNSYDEFFAIGQLIKHQDEEAGNATIVSFEINAEINEVRVNTDKGFAHIDFITAIED